MDSDDKDSLELGPLKQSSKKEDNQSDTSENADAENQSVTSEKSDAGNWPRLWISQSDERNRMSLRNSQSDKRRNIKRTPYPRKPGRTPLARDDYDENKTFKIISCNDIQKHPQPNMKISEYDTFLNCEITKTYDGGGRRGDVNLAKVLKFATSVEEEPILGFTLHPSLHFSERKSHLPTGNTCINRLMLTVPENGGKLPEEDVLFNFFDYAFCNAYYGLQ